MRDRVIRVLSTVFGIGYFPLMPGTVASAAGAGLYLIVKDNPIVYLTLTLFIMTVGFVVSGAAEKLSGATDPKEIVIDELCGIMVVYMFVPFTLGNLILGFALFRLIDITKVYPVNRLEKLRAGWGIMADDIAAGILANIILRILRIICL